MANSEVELEAGPIGERAKSDGQLSPREWTSHLKCQPNSLVGQIHNPMPVILHQKDYSRWLDNIELDRLT